MMKKNIIFFINAIVCLFIFLFIIYMQKDACFIRHDFSLPYYVDFKRFVLDGRIPATILSYLSINLIPSVLNINPNDFRLYFVSVIFALNMVLLCIIWTKSFFISSNDNKDRGFAKLQSLFVFVLSFLLLFIPIDYGSSNFYRTLFLDIRECVVFFEYEFCYVFYFLFMYILLAIINSNKKYGKIQTRLIIINSFFCGLWNEHVNASIFFTLLFLFFIYFIFDRVKLKNRNFLPLLVPFFIGMICFYLFSDYSLNLNTIAAHKYSISQSIGLLKNNFVDFNKEYFSYLFLKNLWAFIFIIVLFCICCIEKIKNAKNILLICFAILFGHLVVNYMYILFQDIGYLFTRTTMVILHNLILSFIIIVLIGVIYNNTKYKYIKIMINLILIGVVLFLIKNAVDNIGKIQSSQYNIRKLLYQTDEISLVYSILGESAILPISVFYNDINGNTGIFLFQDKLEYLNKEQSDKYLLKRYFSEPFFEYKDYFKRQYKYDYNGFSIQSDEMAIKEFSKRLKILQDIVHIEEGERKKDIKFSDLNKYKNIKITVDELNRININDENKYIILKAKANILFNEQNYIEAIKLYEDYLHQNPDDFDALLKIAQIYQKEKTYKKTEEIYNRLHRLDPHNIYFVCSLLIYKDILNSDQTLINTTVNEINSLLKSDMLAAFNFALYREYRNIREISQKYNIQLP